MLKSETKPVKHEANSTDRQGGFSMIEMLVAICVVTFGLASIVGVSAYVSRTNATSNILGVLNTTAQDQSDKLHGAIWDVANEDAKLTIGGSLTYASSDSNHRTQITDTPAGTLNISWKVVAGPGTTGDLRTITIRVVQVNPPARLSEGATVTLIVSKT
jgi:prepilin-type N-terminal cleavage/methylation domain-containing protein